jgi:hypothetical protein
MTSNRASKEGRLGIVVVVCFFDCCFVSLRTAVIMANKESKIFLSICIIVVSLRK